MSLVRSSARVPSAGPFSPKFRRAARRTAEGRSPPRRLYRDASRSFLQRLWSGKVRISGFNILALSRSFAAGLAHFANVALKIGPFFHRTVDFLGASLEQLLGFELHQASGAGAGFAERYGFGPILMVSKKSGGAAAGPGVSGNTVIEKCRVQRVRLLPRIPLFSTHDIIDGQYQIISLLGQGGMGEVYHAFDLRAPRTPDGKYREVALKVLLPGADHLAEAEAVNSVRHPNIVTLYEHGVFSDGTPYLSFEYVDGFRLNNINRGNPMPLETILDIAIQIAEGLAAVHRSGFVHRDLKPDNVVASHNKTIKIVDFGIAKEVKNESSPHEPNDKIEGTPDYMAPEQIRGEPPDTRSDIYALGVMLYQMVSGYLPFAAQVKEMVNQEIERLGLSQVSTVRFNQIKTEVIIKAHLNCVAPEFDTFKLKSRGLKDLPIELGNLIFEMLKKEPSQRPQTMETVEENLQKIKESLGPIPVIVDSYPVTEGNDVRSRPTRVSMRRP